MSAPGCDHVIVRSFLLQHQPHRLHVVACEAPIARRLEVAQVQLVEQSELDARSAITNLPRHELQTAPRRVVNDELADPGVKTAAFGREVVQPALIVRFLDDALHLAERFAEMRTLAADVVRRTQIYGVKWARPLGRSNLDVENEILLQG